MLEHISDLLTTEDICETLNISSSTAYNLFRSGAISGFKCGKGWLTTKESLVAYIQKQTSNTKK